MGEQRRHAEAVPTTIARVVVFALVLAIVLASIDSFDMGDWPITLPIALFALGLVADGAIAWLGGARRREDLARAVGPTMLMWLAIPAAVLLLERSSSIPLDTSNMLGASVGSQLFLMAAAVAVVALFPRAQAIALWLLSSAATTVLLLNASIGLFYGVGQPPVYVAAILAASSIGTLGLYIRGAISKRRGWRPLVWRLALVALAVAFSVAVSTFSTVYVGRGMVAYQSEELLQLRRSYALEVSRQLSSKYGDSEFATATPALASDLAQYAVLNNVGLTIYDRDAARIVASVRWPIAEPSSGSANRFRLVSIGATETAAIVEAVNGGESSVPEDLQVGGFRPLWQPLGYRGGRASPLAGSEATASAGSSTRNTTSPNGTRFALVATEPSTDWTEYPPLSAHEISSVMGVLLAPWLFLSFMLPCTLGLLALDRRDAARAKLAAVEERARLNRDAHDRVYNRLTALANRLAASEPDDAAPPTPADEIRRTVSDLQAILGDGVAAPRVSSADAAASLMTDVCADQGRIWGMDVVLDGAEILQGVDPRLGWELQCIAEEALTNSGRHGRARRARTTLTSEGGTLSLEIADDGIGISAPLRDDGLPSGASGMAGMAQRARAIGGEFEVATGPLGTTVTARVPLRHLPS